MYRLCALLVLFFPISTFLLVFSVILLLRHQTISTFISLTHNPQSVNNFQLVDQLNLGNIINKDPRQDIRVIVLNKFFTDYKSPLSDHTESIVYQSDLWGIDYTLIPAIAMQES